MNGKPGRLPRMEIADELTEAIDELNEVRATGDRLVRIASLVRRLEARRDYLVGGGEA